MSNNVEVQIGDLKKKLSSSDYNIRDSAINEVTLFLNMVIQIDLIQVCVLWEGLVLGFLKINGQVNQEVAAKIISNVAFNLTKPDRAFLFIEAFWTVLNSQWPDIHRTHLNKIYMLMSENIRSSFKLLEYNQWEISAVRSLIDIYIRKCFDIKHHNISSAVPPYIISCFHEQFSKIDDNTTRIGSHYELLISTFLEAIPKTHGKSIQSVYKELEIYIFPKLVNFIENHNSDYGPKYGQFIKVKTQIYKIQLVSKLSKEKHEYIQSQLNDIYEFIIGDNPTKYLQRSSVVHLTESAMSFDCKNYPESKIIKARRPSPRIIVPQTINQLSRHNIKRKISSEECDIKHYMNQKLIRYFEYSNELTLSSDDEYSSGEFSETNTTGLIEPVTRTNNKRKLCSEENNIKEYKNKKVEDCSDISSLSSLTTEDDFSDIEYSVVDISRPLKSINRPISNRHLTSKIEDLISEMKSQNSSSRSHINDYLSSSSEDIISDSDYNEINIRRVWFNIRNNQVKEFKRNSRIIPIQTETVKIGPVPKPAIKRFSVKE
ncbi:hypothetical protein CONCODRAFT_74054 [Conidiobolus coronatus NRRL 28638]|uniref:Uncharacterized protein n=1 Tax=Conidiobolus coronatus (strain ATCC 28846 / CBS 209.66 / NRRL 28638) TaxID=796925 RepID=A0A137NSZ0_CONC2|nr:hypothetical protein CONCODRAFT_74054 [Conidiobolus coronatus NRRL 28638]|eukprot:KXN65861.1 hypothetical protein CONCODRAFT_74054 [Conidiobolus coronatus NRRL 28638]